MQPNTGTRYGNCAHEYQYNLERIGGKSMLFAAGLNDWFASLWQLRKLPFTIAVLASILALLCFLLAHFIALPILDDEDDPGRNTPE